VLAAGVIASVFLAPLGVDPGGAFVGGALACIFWLARRRQVLTSHGSARFASAREIARAGFTRGSGIVLGRDHRGRLLRMPDWAVHALICAPTGTGKGVSIIVPTLMTYTRGSVIVLDLKNGENYKLCAAMRRQLGRQVVRLDVWDVAGPEPLGACQFNPLSLLVPGSSTLVDDVRMLAVAVILRSPNEHQPFFNDMATLTLHLLILFVALHAGEEERHWGSVVALAKNPAAFLEAVSRSMVSKEAGGALAELAGSVSYLFGNREQQRGSEFHSVLSTLATHLAAFESEVVKAAFSATTLDLSGLRRGEMDLFVCMDAGRLESHQAIPRLWLTALLQFLIAHSRGAEVLIIADEIAQLGRGIPMLESAITLLRSYRVRLACFVQALPQLAKIFPTDQGQTALANFDVQIFFAVNDTATASAISQRLGAATIEVETRQGGGSSGRSGGFGQVVTINNGESWGISTAPHGRALVMPDEAFLLTGLSIVFVRGRRPVLARLIRYFDDPAFSGRKISRGNVGFWLVALVLAALLLAWLIRPWEAGAGGWPVPVETPPEAAPLWGSPG
jgi:type IV secretion system protein VirD4